MYCGLGDDCSTRWESNATELEACEVGYGKADDSSGNEADGDDVLILRAVVAADIEEESSVRFIDEVVPFVEFGDVCCIAWTDIAGEAGM